MLLYQEEIFLLGSGSMANITKIFFEKSNKEYKQFSRKIDGDITKLDFSILQKTDKDTLIINSCSRVYNFEGRTPMNTTFWDYNYSHSYHENTS